MVWRREQLLELGKRRGRKIREDPAAVVVEHDDRGGGSARPPVRTEQPVRIVQETQVAAQTERGCRPTAPARRRSPSTRSRRCRWRPGWRARAARRGAPCTTRARVRAGSTRPPVSTRRAARPRHRAATLPSLASLEPSRTRVDRGAGPTLGMQPVGRPFTRHRRPGDQFVGHRREQRLRVDREALRRPVLRVEPLVVGIDEHLGNGCVEPRGRDLARERRAHPHDEIGSVRLGEPGRTQQRFVRGDRELSVAQPRDRIGEHRPARGRREPRRGRRARRRRPTPRPEARAGARAPARRAAPHRPVEARASPPKTASTAAHPARPGASTSGAPVGRSGSRNGRLRCTGPAGGPSVSATARHASARHADSGARHVDRAGRDRRTTGPLPP